MRKADVWLYRIGIAIATFVGVSIGCRYAGRYHHEQYANEKAHRTRSEEEERTDALELAHGYADTKGYLEMSYKLSAEEMTKAYAAPDPLEQNAAKIAGLAALVVGLAAGEAARIWATKREAKRRLSGRY